jgi:hypothetical protein
MTPILIKAKAKLLHASDADKQWIASSDDGNTMQAVLSSLPSDLRCSRPVYSFSLAVWHVTGRRYLLSGLLRLFNDFVVILGPFCLRGLVSSMAPVYANPQINSRTRFHSWSTDTRHRLRRSPRLPAGDRSKGPRS